MLLPLYTHGKLRPVILIIEMNVLSDILESKLWVKGCDRVIFGNVSDWEFYYCIEGIQTKTWHLIFYSPSSNRLYARSLVIDFKVEHVILRTHNYVSNVYRLFLERPDKRSMTAWSVIEKPLSIDSPSSIPRSTAGIVTPANSQIYYCTPPIMFRDSFFPLKVLQTQHVTNSNNDPTKPMKSFSTTAGYVSYKGNPSDHARHFMKTWIPTISVDSGTFAVSFEVVYNTPRKRGECLECVCPDKLWSPDVSNLLINH